MKHDNKGPSSQSYVFSSSHVWMWELNYKESWALKNWCFWTVLCWRRLLRVPWTVWRSNQSIRKEISPEYSLEELMLKLKLQYFGHVMQRTDSLEKTLMLRKIEGGRRSRWLWRRLSAQELMLLNCGVGEDSWESLGLEGDPTSPSERKSVLNIHWKDWCWSWSSNALVIWCKELTHWKRHW